MARRLVSGSSPSNASASVIRPLDKAYHKEGGIAVLKGSLAPVGCKKCNQTGYRGRVAILDFHPRGFFSGLLGHGTAKEDVRHEMEAAGYRLVNEYDFIESQHFQIFTKAEP